MRHSNSVPVPLFPMLETVARDYGTTVRAITGPTRRPEVCAARSTVAFKLRQLGYSYPRIGRMLGGRHHTTVMFMLRALPEKKPADRGVTYPDLSGEWAI